MHSKNPLKIILNAFNLKTFIKQNNIHILHARSRACAWSAYLASLMTDTVFVTTFHGVYGSGNPVKRLYNSIMLKGKVVIAISNFIKKHIETRYHFISSRLRVIYRGVDLNLFSPQNVTDDRKGQVKALLGAELKGKVILLPARFTRLKGHEYLLNALRYLKKVDYTCVMAGTFSDRSAKYIQEIENTIKEYGLKDKVIIAQAIADMPALYALCDVVVSTSVQPEAFGRTIIEAQAMEKIVIATAIGAATEIIENGKTGFLVSSMHSYEVCKILNEVLNLREEEANKIKAAAIEKAKNMFTLEKMCSETVAVYRELVEDNL